mmetsp:Transcript_47984/g.133839  ORF Transcript_47984/g.133839 Transcript_47984/m.133839 type:complete len:214 (-) Transcript_47984:1525-2166(-)
MVAGHHDDYDPGLLRLQDRLGHSWLRRILDPIESEELVIVHGKIAVASLAPLEDLVFWGFGCGDVALGGAQDAAPLLHETVQHVVDLGLSLGVHLATTQDALWRSFEEGHVRRLSLFRRAIEEVLVGVHCEHPLVLRVKRNLENSGMLSTELNRLVEAAHDLGTRVPDGKLGRRPHHPVVFLFCNLRARIQGCRHAQRPKLLRVLGNVGFVEA